MQWALLLQLLPVASRKKVALTSEVTQCRVGQAEAAPLIGIDLAAAVCGVAAFAVFTTCLDSRLGISGVCSCCCCYQD